MRTDDQKDRTEHGGFQNRTRSWDNKNISHRRQEDNNTYSWRHRGNDQESFCIETNYAGQSQTIIRNKDSKYEEASGSNSGRRNQVLTQTI